jgi:dolichyl-phosphate beta-glucosyltransferase
MTSKNNNKKPGKREADGARDGAPYLSVVIPAYNEEQLIADTLSKVTAFLDSKPYPYEVIVADDGSRDRTREIVSQIAAKKREVRLLDERPNRGKGFSVRSGFLAARGKLVCFSDADLSTPIEDVDKLIAWIDRGFDVAIGSRALAESDVQVHQPWWRELMGKTFNAFVQTLAVSGIKDTQCGFKCFTNAAARQVFSMQRLDGFSFDVEALYIASKLGYRIMETPIKWVNRFESRVNPLLHPLQMLRDLIRIRIWGIIGRYGKN